VSLAVAPAAIAGLGMLVPDAARAAVREPADVTAVSSPNLGFPEAWDELRGRQQSLPVGNWEHVEWSSLPGMRVARVQVLGGVENADGSCTPQQPETSMPERPFSVFSRQVAIDMTTCRSVWQLSEPYVSSKSTQPTAVGTSENSAVALASGTNSAHNQEYTTDPVNIVLNAVVANITYSFTGTSVTYQSGYCSKYKFSTTKWYEYTTYQCTRSSVTTSSSANKVFVNVGNATYANSTFCPTGTTYVRYNNVRIAGNPNGSFTASHSALSTIWGGCSGAVYRSSDVGWGSQTL
jgi:hypothetical protein